MDAVSSVSSFPTDIEVKTLKCYNRNHKTVTEEQIWQLWWTWHSSPACENNCAQGNKHLNMSRCGLKEVHG